MEAAKKPYLRHGIKAKRLNYAQEHRNSGEEKWQHVLWTDESKLQATVKLGGGSLRVWSHISANGVGYLVRTNGVLNAEKYGSYLSIPSGRRMIGPKCILQQDNNPKHTANVINNYLQCKEDQEALEGKVWPHQSPDLNIIKSDRDYRKRKVDLRSLHPQKIC